MRNNQHGFTKRKSYLINLVNIYDETITLVDEGKAVNIVYLDFTKASDTISCRILIKKHDEIWAG